MIQWLKHPLLRYLAVGTVAYAVEMAALFGLHKILGLSSLKSVAISFWIGFVTAFLLQKFIAFENHDRRLHIVARQIIIYSLLVAWNYLVTLICVQLFSKHISVLVVRTGTIVLTTSWNFFIYRTIFKTAPEIVPS